MLDESSLEACDRLIHETFTSTKPGAEPEGLMRRLEQVTEMPRTAWPSLVLRRFWEAQMEVVAGRQLEPGVRSAVAQPGRLCLAARLRHGGG